MDSLTKQIKAIVAGATMDEYGNAVTQQGDCKYKFFCYGQGIEGMLKPLVDKAKKKERELTMKCNGTDADSMMLYRDEQKRNQQTLKYLYDHIDDLGTIRCHAEDIECILGYIKEDNESLKELDARYQRDNISYNEFVKQQRYIESHKRELRYKIDAIKACHNGIDVVLAWKMCPPNYIAMAERRGVCVMG